MYSHEHLKGNQVSGQHFPPPASPVGRQMSSPFLLISDNQRQKAQILAKDLSISEAGCDLILVIHTTETCVQEPVLRGNKHLLSLPTQPTSAYAFCSSSRELPCTQQPNLSCFPCSPHFQAPKFPNKPNANLSNLLGMQLQGRE